MQQLIRIAALLACAVASNGYLSPNIHNHCVPKTLGFSVSLIYILSLRM